MRIPVIDRIVRSLKRPRPDAWDDFWYGMQPYENSSGAEVSEATALRFSTVWSCVKVISEDISSLPLQVYRRTADGKEKADDHPLYYLLHDAPNDEMSAMQFREAMQSHLLTWGNAYAEIIRNYMGQPTALWPLNPANMTVTRPNDALIYEYVIQNGEKRYFPARDIFHIAGLGYNGLIGYSPISYQRELIGSGLASQTWQATNLKDGCRLQVVFSHPAPKAPNKEGRDAVNAELRKQYGGQSGNKIGVLWEGMKAEPISMTMQDAQFIENRKFTRSEICGIYRVPPHKVMDLERATFSNIEHQGIQYVVDAIRPWSVRWEQAINQKLLNGSTKFFAEHNVDGLLRGDIQSRYSAYAIGRQWGWLSVNDIREKENMNPVPGGDIRLQPMNMTELGETSTEAAAASGQDEFTQQELQQAASALRHLRLIRRA